MECVSKEMVKLSGLVELPVVELTGADCSESDVDLSGFWNSRAIISVVCWLLVCGSGSLVNGWKFGLIMQQKV